MSLSRNKNQKGNVLFLILIAVALFAALSYAVTQSSRSGGDASKETNVINTASLTQYPNSIRTSVLRLIIAGNDPLQLQFNKPDQFETGFEGLIPTRAVFHPQGGGAAYQQVPANIVDAGAAVDWRFNANFQVPLLGLAGTGGSGNELIAFAYGIAQSVCARVNQELHNDGTIPQVAAALAQAVDATGTGINNSRTATTVGPPQTPIAPTTSTVLTSTGGTNWFSNKAFGCFQNGPDAEDPYVFYYVLAER